MEKLLDASSLPTLVATGCVLVAMHLLMRVGEFLWRFKERKDQLTEKTIQSLARAVESNTLALAKIDADLKSLNLGKLKTDLRRAFHAVKLLAGDKWSPIRKEIMEDDQ